jgi:hypothetical protein
VGINPVERKTSLVQTLQGSNQIVYEVLLNHLFLLVELFALHRKDFICNKCDLYYLAVLLFELKIIDAYVEELSVVIMGLPFVFQLVPYFCVVFLHYLSEIHWY